MLGLIMRGGKPSFTMQKPLERGWSVAPIFFVQFVFPILKVSPLPFSVELSNKKNC